MDNMLLVSYAFENWTGIGRYSILLDEGLTNIQYPHSKFAYMPFNHINGKSGKLLNPIIRRLLLHKEIAKYSPPLIHLTQPYGYEVLLHTKAKKVLTWYDDFMITKTSGITKRYNFYRSMKAIKMADAITFISKKSEIEFRELFSKDILLSNKILITNPIPIADIWINHKVDKNIHRSGFIYIGGIHKNFTGLISAFGDIISNTSITLEPLLHIYTSDNIENELAIVKSKGLKRYVVFHNNATDIEILEQLKKSVALLHLTLDEGYGLPIMESIAVGTPVITLDTAKIPDEVKKWTIQTSLKGVIGEAIKLYESPRQAKEESIRYAKSLNKKGYAKEIIKIYEKMI